MAQRRRRRREGCRSGNDVVVPIDVRISLAVIVDRIGRLRGNEDGAACGSHSLDGGISPVDSVGISAWYRKYRENALALRTTHLVSDAGDRFSLDGHGRLALEDAAAMRCRVDSANDRSSSQLILSLLGARVRNVPPSPRRESVGDHARCISYFGSGRRSIMKNRFTPPLKSPTIHTTPDRA